MSGSAKVYTQKGADVLKTAVLHQENQQISTRFASSWLRPIPFERGRMERSKPETINYRSFKPERDGLFANVYLGRLRTGTATVAA